MIPQTPILFWQYFDVLTLGILSVVVGSLVLSHRRTHGSFLKTISQTVAHSKNSSLIFSITMSICFPLYYAFIWFWVAPLIHMPTGFYFLLAVSALFELVFVWVPSKPGKTKIIHDLASGFVGIVMLVLPILILLYGDMLTGFMKTTILLYLAVTIALSISLSQVSLRKYVFLFEVVYIVAFVATVSVIAHG